MDAERSPIRPDEASTVNLTAGQSSSISDTTDEGRFPPGAMLGQRYRIVTLLGRGGMGEVYRATDLTLNQTVALKFLPEALGKDPAALNRLYNEVRLARQISHPNVCRVYDIGEVNGLRFLTMEYVDGEDLASLLRRIGRLPVEKATEIGRRLCAGLAAAHDRGVLHRDLKPANIMIDAKGNVRIMDYGLAVLSGRLDVPDPGSGTPAYMAPEQLARQEVSIRSDIYSLGLLLYEIFGGHRAFEASSIPELLRLKREAKLPALSRNIDIDPRIERAIMHCLEPDPRARPVSAAAVAAELSPGDPLAAMIAAGETPSPELVARAGAMEGLPVRVAFACLSGVIAGLIIFALLAPRLSILSRVPVQSSDNLERIARDTLSSLGIGEGATHHAARFSYDLDALRGHFDPAALYFWYRASPYWMIPRGLTAVITPNDPPGELPGMVTTKWDGTGHLLYLHAVPPAVSTANAGMPELWTHLFAAAGLQPAQFEPAESRWISAPGWDSRATWTGTYPDEHRTPIRIEAAAWQGRPVYFEVVPAWRNGARVPPAITIEREISRQLAAFIVVFAASAMLAWRNVRLGRGDRRGTFRIAVFLFAGSLLSWACETSHVLDVTEFTLLFLRILDAGFFAMGFCSVYMALEPYVRRRWPHAIISWSRILSGKLRDPVVGGDILVGTIFGVASMVLIAIGSSLAGIDSLRLPSYRVLSGPATTLAQALAYTQDAVGRALSLLFLTFFFRVFFRKEWLAPLGMVALAFVFDAPTSPLTPGAFILIVVPLAVAFVYLLLRKGLVPVVAAIYTFDILVAVPLTADLSAPATGASIFLLCSVAALALFGFHSTLGGRPLFKLELD
jgi:Protein kinase domain